MFTMLHIMTRGLMIHPDHNAFSKYDVRKYQGNRKPMLQIAHKLDKHGIGL